MALPLADIDARIAALRTEVDSIGMTLGELDGDVTLKLLASATLSGQTAAAWADVTPKLDLLWQYYGAVKDTVAQVVAARGTKARLEGELEEQLTAMLTGTSVPLPPNPGAPVPRTLTATQPGETIARVLAAMGPLYQEVVAVVDRVGTAWTSLPRLDGFEATLTGLTQRASQAGLKPPAEIAAVRSQISALREKVKSDPLAVSLADVDAVAGRVEAAAELLRGATEARAQLAARLEATAALLDETGALIVQARAAEAEGALKILGPPQARGPHDLDDLAARHNRLGSNHKQIAHLAHGNWQEARRLLGELDQQATALRAAAAEALAAFRSPIEARNELRGRLDAYQAKAQARGYAEDRRITEMYERARTALFTAPCDLAAADALVRAYQEALSPAQPGSPAGGR